MTLEEWKLVITLGGSVKITYVVDSTWLVIDKMVYMMLGDVKFHMPHASYLEFFEFPESIRCIEYLK